MWLPIITFFTHQDHALKALFWNTREMFAPPSSDIKFSSINYGVYDPSFDPDVHRTFSDAKDVAIEHIFISWLYPDLTSDGSSVAERFDYSQERNRWLMVTVEPVSDGREPVSGDLLKQIGDGAYDENITAVCKKLGGLNAPIFIRWGHEMDSPNNRYPWSHGSPDDYISAYRHFVTTCREWIRNGYYIWSPLGVAGFADYWPGKKYVDYVGLIVFGTTQIDILTLGQPRSFTEVFTPLYERVIAFDLPVMIAELGVEGEPAYQDAWLRGLFRNAKQFPLLKTAVYFNAKDVVKWAEELDIPDWRVSGQVFE